MLLWFENLNIIQIVEKSQIEQKPYIGFSGEACLQLAIVLFED